MTWGAARATVTGAMRNAAAQGNRAPDSAGADKPRDVGVAASPHRRSVTTVTLAAFAAAGTGSRAFARDVFP